MVRKSGEFNTLPAQTVDKASARAGLNALFFFLLTYCARNRNVIEFRSVFDSFISVSAIRVIPTVLGIIYFTGFFVIYSFLS